MICVIKTNIVTANYGNNINVFKFHANGIHAKAQFLPRLFAHKAVDAGNQFCGILQVLVKGIVICINIYKGSAQTKQDCNYDNKNKMNPLNLMADYIQTAVLF